MATKKQAEKPATDKPAEKSAAKQPAKPAAGIGKHKSAATRKVARHPVAPAAAAKPATSATVTAGGSKSFDIIPRNRVRASASSRPVITATMPQVADNTLTMPSGAPELHIKRRSMTLKPGEAFSGDESGVAPELESKTKDAKHEQQGVSVADLIAKKRKTADSKAADGGTKALAAEKAADPAVHSTPIVDVERVTSDGVIKSGGSVGGLTIKPPSGAVAAAAATPVADVTAAPVPASQPAGGAVAAVTPASAGAADAAPIAASAGTAAPSPAAPTAADAAAAPAVAPEAAAADPAEPAAGSADDDSLERALREDSSAPQEHSQAFKDALSEIKDKASTEPEHHDLYGGKPVIVVHKDYGAKAVLMWLLWFLVCLAIAVLIIDLLLDAGIVTTTYNVPYTHFF